MGDTQGSVIGNLNLYQGGWTCTQLKPRVTQSTGVGAVLSGELLGPYTGLHGELLRAGTGHKEEIGS